MTLKSTLLSTYSIITIIIKWFNAVQINRNFIQITHIDIKDQHRTVFNHKYSITDPVFNLPSKNYLKTTKNWSQDDGNTQCSSWLLTLSQCLHINSFPIGKTLDFDRFTWILVPNPWYSLIWTVFQSINELINHLNLLNIIVLNQLISK